MSDGILPRRGALILLRLLVVTVTSALCLAPSVATAKPAAPQLSISVDNGRTTTQAGEKLAYTVTVTNLGATAIRDLVVTQTVPAGASFGSADGRGQQRAGTISWRVQLKATGQAAMHSTLTVAPRPPDHLWRLATVACARVTLKGPPLVCAADSDELPAGAVARVAGAKSAEVTPLLKSVQGQVAIAAVVAVMLGLLTAFVLRRRRAEGVSRSARRFL